MPPSNTKNSIASFLLGLLAFPILGLGGLLRADDSVATAAQAAAVIDLSKLAPIEPAGEVGMGSIAGLTYESQAKVDAVATQIQKQLEKLGWKVLPGATITDAYANLSLGKQDYTLSVNVSPNPTQGTSMVMIANLGNVDYSKLPMPSGTKTIIATPGMIMVERATPAERTLEECKSLLSEKGWTPFGDTTATFFVRKNAVRLQWMVSPSPTDPKKSMIQVTGELMAADFPELGEVMGLQYSSPPTQLFFDGREDREYWVEKLGRELGELGWKPTTEGPIKVGFKEAWIFLNPKKEMMEIELSRVDEKTRIRMIHTSAERVETLNKKAEEAAAQAQAKRDAEMKKKANPTAIKIDAPVGAKLQEETAKQLEFSIGSGNAKKAVAKWLEARKKEGWEVKAIVEAAEAGEFELTQGELRMAIGYLDPGFIPGSIEVSVSGDAKLQLQK